MATSYKLHGTRPTGYGYGWFVRTIRGKNAFEHGGDIGGFSADIMRLPQEGIFIARARRVKVCSRKYSSSAMAAG